jgi:hypothetical protein
MKKLFALATVAVLVLAACGDGGSNKPGIGLTKFTIKNESSYDLSNVSFCGETFSVSGSSDLPHGANVAKAIDKDQSGYISFTRKDIGMACRTDMYIMVANSNVFVFIDNTVVVEQGNTSNKNTLAAMDYLSQISVLRGELVVQKNSIENLGEGFVGYNPVQSVFTINNSGKGKLLLDLFGNSVSSRTSPAFFRAERLPTATSALQKCFLIWKLFRN